MGFVRLGGPISLGILTDLKDDHVLPWSKESDNNTLIGRQPSVSALNNSLPGNDVRSIHKNDANKCDDDISVKY